MSLNRGMAAAGCSVEDWEQRIWQMLSSALRQTGSLLSKWWGPGGEVQHLCSPSYGHLQHPSPPFWDLPPALPGFTLQKHEPTPQQRLGNAGRGAQQVTAGTIYMSDKLPREKQGTSGNFRHLENCNAENTDVYGCLLQGQWELKIIISCLGI